MAQYPNVCGSSDDCIIKGDDGWNSSGDQAIYQMGDSNHYILAQYGFGVKIGTAGVGDVVNIAENSGKVGLGQSSPATRLHVGGAVTFDTESTPSAPAIGKAVMWWDGSDLKVKRNVGGTIKTCTITGGWAT